MYTIQKPKSQQQAKAPLISAGPLPRRATLRSAPDVTSEIFTRLHDKYHDRLLNAMTWRSATATSLRTSPRRPFFPHSETRMTFAGNPRSTRGFTPSRSANRCGINAAIAGYRWIHSESSHPRSSSSLTILNRPRIVPTAVSGCVRRCFASQRSTAMCSWSTSFAVIR